MTPKRSISWGQLYETGDGVEQDYEQAAYCTGLRRSRATATDSTIWVISMIIGYGTEVDFKQAMYWYIAVSCAGKR